MTYAALTLTCVFSFATGVIIASLYLQPEPLVITEIEQRPCYGHQR